MPATAEDHAARIVEGLDGWFAECLSCQLESPLSTTREGAEVYALSHLVEQMAAAAPTPGPCPSWCTSPACAMYEISFADDELHYVRYHADVKSDHVSVEQVEHVRDGVAVLDPIRVQLAWDNMADDGLTPDGARGLAAQLLQGAADAERHS